tara:strand:+ start:155 stop:334 length:180 start_codon:yes stop_codon:yes gene_type:complete
MKTQPKDLIDDETLAKLEETLKTGLYDVAAGSLKPESMLSGYALNRIRAIRGTFSLAFI